MSIDHISAIERAKAIVAAAKQKAAEKEAARLALLPSVISADAMPVHAPTTTLPFALNEEQQQAVDYGYFGRSFCLIGAAGTGKTTTLKAVLQTMIEQHRIPMLETSTRYLQAGTPGVALIAYTRRAVRNIAKQMPASLKSHCVTFHKLIEFAPEWYEVTNPETDETTSKMRFAPTFNRMNPLPRGLRTIVVDEASMLSTDDFQKLVDALPDPLQVQFIFLGDLNQLPPVYGIPILGKKLLELPVIELHRVYRQALESPIISLALSVKNNNFDQLHSDLRHGVFEVEGADPRVIDLRRMPAGKIKISKPGRGSVTLHTWKRKLDKDDGLMAMQSHFRLMIKEGNYEPDEDLVLCPWNTSFGTDELNKAIADFLGKRRGAVVHEVIAGFNKHYFAVGDKLMVEKQEAIILEIEKNPRYLGKRPQAPSIEMNRWGVGSQAANPFDDMITDDELDAMLEANAGVEDRTTESSHRIRVRFLDSGLEELITQAAVLNASQFGYAMTVHKSQGSECRRVFLITSHAHAAMCSRELIYTGITRAAEELYIVMESQMLGKAASKPRIKGDTLQDKIAFFEQRIREKEAAVEIDDVDD